MRWSLLPFGCAILLVACSPDTAPRVAADAPVVAPAENAPRQLRDVRRLVIDLASRLTCRGLRDRMLTIHAEREGDPHRGRIWLRECGAHARRDRLDIDLGASSWVWVDQSARTAGATFQVREYVHLSAETTLRTVPEIEYDRRGHYAYLWLRPIDDPEVSTRTIAPVDADPEGAWSHVVGVFARIFGQRPDDRARTMVDVEGDRAFEQIVDPGFTIMADLCTGGASMEMGHLRAPPFPRPDRGEFGETTPVALHPRGLDVHGPISDGDEMIVRMRAEGGPVRGRLVCRDAARELMSAFQSGRPLPEVTAVADRRIARGETRALRGGRCSLYIVSVPASDTPATVSFAMRPARDTREALVPGCHEEHDALALGPR